MGVGVSLGLLAGVDWDQNQFRLLVQDENGINSLILD
jgi:hypothetical protein